jgi:hypothetical protein
MVELRYFRHAHTCLRISLWALHFCLFLLAHPSRLLGRGLSYLYFSSIFDCLFDAVLLFIYYNRDADLVVTSHTKSLFGNHVEILTAAN